jgi:hypothetical protein
VKISVFRSARRKLSSCHGVVKLSKPTQFPVSEPPIGVREAEVDRPDERHADDERHEDDGRGDEQRARTRRLSSACRQRPTAVSSAAACASMRAGRC